MPPELVNDAPHGRGAAPLTAYLALGASMAIVGGYVGVSKVLIAVFPVFLLAWLRFGIAAVAMLGWLRRGPTEPPLDRSDMRLLFVESFFGNFLFSICMLYGVSMTPASVAGVVLAALPAAVALLSRAFLGELITRRVGIAIALAVGGIAVVSFAKDTAGAQPASWLGLAMLVGAVFCEAAYVVVGKRLTGRVAPRRISALINLWGLLLVTPLGLWQATRFDFGAVASASWLQLVAYAAAASMLTVWLWMTGLRHVAASSAGVFTVLLPVSAAAVGVVFLGETVNVVQGIAFGLAIAGLLLATWPTRAAAGAEHQPG